jgi:hypothetical protein
MLGIKRRHATWGMETQRRSGHINNRTVSVSARYYIWARYGRSCKRYCPRVMPRITPSAVRAGRAPSEEDGSAGSVGKAHRLDRRCRPNKFHRLISIASRTNKQTNKQSLDHAVTTGRTSSYCNINYTAYLRLN